ncbi:histone-lysine N-methyltransferase SETDB2 isoform X4 [Hypanus sabinus]|uniref:histone-lysine N-methyltransferase SETDB2 isoform X4 n=2 Tax=Hypanus sabinus TaxID=79690 RepID=UPI0028C45177|nr:histone-lysine N-methyltransferase SETDB2 isoform X4 [Hypanus sabinus]
MEPPAGNESASAPERNDFFRKHGPAGQLCGAGQSRRGRVGPAARRGCETMQGAGRSKMPSKCGFCKRTKEEVCNGEMLLSQDGQLVLHRRCLLFSAVPLASKMSKNNNLSSKTVQAIKKELRKAAKMKCSHCHQSGAAVKCAATYCRKVYHYPCVRSDNGAVRENEFRGVYRVWCHKHKTEQKFVEDSSSESAEDVPDAVCPREEELEHQEGQNACGQKVDPQGHSPCSQTEMLMNHQAKNSSKTCYLQYAASTSAKLIKCIDEGVDSLYYRSHSSYEDESDEKALGLTSGSCFHDNGDEENCSYSKDDLKQKMTSETKDGSNNRNSNEEASIFEKDHLELRDVNTEKSKESRAELLQSKENSTETEENALHVDCHNLEKAELFWNKVQASGSVELVFEQLSNVLNCLKNKIVSGSANNQEYLKAFNLLSEAGIYICFSPDVPVMENEGKQVNCEERSENVTVSEEMEAESVSDSALFSRTSVIKSLAPSAICPPANDFHHTSLPDPKIFHQHKCSRMCIAGVMPPTSDNFKGENPLKIPILCQFQRRHAKLHWNTEILEPPHVSYKAPCGRSLRNFKEVRSYIFETQSDFLLLDFFSFNTYVQLSRTFPSKSPMVYKADISHGIEAVPIPLHNAIDLTAPEHFKYRKVRLPYGYLISNSAEMLQQKCNCTDGCSDKSRCACQKLTAKVNKRFGKTSGYEYKRLLQCAPSGLYECNKWCKCNKRLCENRVVQQGLTIRLQLFKTHKRGWGVRCMDDVDKGTFVCSYAGRILRIANDMESQNDDKTINFNATDLCSSKTKNTCNTRETKESNSETEHKLLEEMEEIKASLKKEETTSFVKTSPLITQKGCTEFFGREKPGFKKFDLHNPGSSSVERPKTKTALLQAQRRKLQQQGHILETHSSSEEDESDSLAERPKRHCRSFQHSSPRKHKTLSDNQPINSCKGASGKRSRVGCGRNSSTPLSQNIFERALLTQQEIDKQENNTNNENANTQKELIPDNSHNEQMSKLHLFCKGDDQGDCYFLDATEEGNIGRFLNHSCDPNLMVQSVFVDTHDKNFPWVAFFTNRYVKAGSELTWDYNYLVGTTPEEEIPCFCGSIKCKNIIV